MYDLGKKTYVAFPEMVAGSWYDCLTRSTYFTRKMGIVFKMSPFSGSFQCWSPSFIYAEMKVGR